MTSGLPLKVVAASIGSVLLSEFRRENPSETCNSMQVYESAINDSPSSTLFSRFGSQADSRGGVEPWELYWSLDSHHGFQCVKLCWVSDVRFNRTQTQAESGRVCKSNVEHRVELLVILLVLQTLVPNSIPSEAFCCLLGQLAHPQRQDRCRADVSDTSRSLPDAARAT